MKPNTCLVIDVWEGQLEIDEALLKAHGVAGIGIRLNDMNGGHHMDTGFVKQWEEAVNFVRFPYFVYNPWETGRGNYTWLRNNMPASCSVVAVDIEVAKPGYTTKAYADAFADFLTLCRASNLKVIVYTGQWFLPYLQYWPDIDYWWAQYPASTTFFNNVTTWEEVKIRLDALTLPFNSTRIPGKLKLWQFSGDWLQLPGTVRKIDVNLFYGNEQDLSDYFQYKPTSPIPVKNYLLCTFAEAAYWHRPAGGPLVTPFYDVSKGSGQKELILDKYWQAYMQAFNTPKAWEKLSAPDWGPSKGFNGNGNLILNTLVYPGRNIVQVNGIGTGLDGEEWASIQTINITKSLDPTYNYRDHPELYHRVYGSNGNYSWFPLTNSPVVPLLSDGPAYVQMKWLEPLQLPRIVKATSFPWLNIREIPDVLSKVVGRKYYGQSITIVDVVIAKGGIWGKCESGGWVALRYNDSNLTDWII